MHTGFLVAAGLVGLIVALYPLYTMLPALRSPSHAAGSPDGVWNRTLPIAASLVTPAESHDDRARREMNAFCRIVPRACAKLSKAEKRAMFLRFRDEGAATPPK